MNYSPWLLKNLINWNRLKKFTQVGIDVKCMHTDFGGRGLFGFGDKISLWSIKVEKFNLLELAKKIMQVGIDIKCMHTSFGGCGLSGSRDIATFKNGQISLSRHGLYSPWSSKNLIDWKRLKKFTQVGIDVKCMHTDFGGCGLSGFGDKISLWSIKVHVEKFNRSESAQKIYASRD